MISIAAGGNHSIALRRDGTVWTWGANGFGQLGDFATTAGIATPIQVDGIAGVKAIAGGGSHSCALAEDGTVWTWGDNRSGQLGTGDRTSRKTPLRVNGLDPAKAIDGGWAYTIVLQEDGTVWTWGSNGDGQLGDGAESSRTSPVQVTG